MARPMNPYVAGNPVGDSHAFVGRADVVREVVRVLRRPQDNAIVLYGQRRIGKTSILQHLAAVLPQEGPYRAVYFDLQDKAAWPLGRVLQDLARTIANALGQPDPDLGSDPETAFRQEWLPAVLGDLPEGCSLVLLFDEFDVLADPQTEQAAAAFFPYLRDLLASDPQRLQFVFVIGRNVDDLTNIALSLFKGTPAQRVSLLSRKDTIDLVRLSEANGTLRWPDEAVERIWQLTCGHPFLTQQLCSHVWEQVYDEEPSGSPIVTPEDVDAAIPDALEASRNTLEWLWDGLPPAERVVASVLAGVGPSSITQEGLEQLLHESGVRIVIRELQNAPQLLQEWDLIEPSNDGYRFRVELLRRWIIEHKPLRRVQEELDRIEPVAESLYRAGLGYYQNEQFEQAIGALRQAIGLNPNHVGANQLLADILLAQGRPREAQQLLEQLYEYQPAAARSRLVQALLAQARAVDGGDKQLTYLRRMLKRLRPDGTVSRIDKQLIIYEKVLELDSMQSEAIAGRQRIWEQRGDTALESDDLDTALEAYRKAGLTDKVTKTEQEIRHRDLNARLREAEALEQKRRYDDALYVVHRLADEYSEMRSWVPDFERLERKIRLVDPYQRALEALQNGDRGTAQTLLAKVIDSDPGFEDATRYLHLAVTNVDVAKVQAKNRRMIPLMLGAVVAGMLLGIALGVGTNRLLAPVLLPSQTHNIEPSPTSSVAMSAASTMIPTGTPTTEPMPIDVHVSPPPVTQPVPIITSTMVVIVSTVAPNLWGLHQVCAGQTLSEIATTYSTTVDYLATINPVLDPNQLSTGILLFVPWQARPNELPDFVLHSVTTDDTLTALADKYATSVEAIQAANDLADPNLIYPDQSLRIPVGLTTVLRTNGCADFFGVLDHPSGLDVYLRSSPALGAVQASLVVANKTPLQVLGQNPGARGGPWYKVIVKVRAGGYRTGWLRSAWVRLDGGISSQDIPFIEQ